MRSVKRSASGKVYMVEVDETHYVEVFFILEDEECEENYIPYKACGIKGFTVPNMKQVREKDEFWDRASYMSEKASREIVRLIEEAA